MWKDIVLSIGMSIGEALCINQLDSKKRKKHSGKIESILQKELEQFSDSSLDNPSFHSYVKGLAFKQHMQGYFYTNDFQQNHVQSYKKSMVECVSDAVPNIKADEMHCFLDRLIRVYEDYLRKVIENDPVIEALYQLLINANQNAWSRIVKEQSEIMAYLKAHLTSEVVINDKDILTYHEICQKEYSTVRFTGIASAESRQYQNINDIFIESGFSYEHSSFREQYVDSFRRLPSITLKNLFDISNRIVLLGGAGLGKTTTLNYLYCNYQKLFGPCVVKVKIDLKQYAKDIFESNKDILSCIASDFYRKVKRKNTSLETVSTLLSEIFEKGHCLIILDALDEINSQAARNRVRDEIAVFSDLYPLNRIIISSRETGYLRNRFDGSFLHLRIKEFERNQIKQYAHNWYKFNSIPDKRGAWKRFQAEVTRARCEKLISNPIILILALIIFDIEKNLPNKRVEFYQKCIDTFLSIREERRGTHNLSDKAKNILADDSVVPQIAHYKFERDQNDMDYCFTTKELTEAIFEAIKVSDPINWRSAVQAYSQYLVERTELIQETDEDTLDFAHKTFYEYFLAVYYAKEYDEVELSDLLLKWIGDSNLDELARLIIEVVIKNNNSRQHQSIIDFLFSKIREAGDRDFHLSVSILTVFSELYSHNMLLPKFHRQYYECLLENANIIHRIEINNGFHGADETIIYDGKLVADLFLEKANCEEITTKIIDDLYYFDDAFQDRIMELRPDSQYGRIIQLFRCIRDEKNSDDIDTKKIVDYFTNGDGYRLIIKYPQIYLTMLGAMNFLTDDNLKSLVRCEFDYNSLFLKFTKPAWLNGWFNRAAKSSTAIIILLNIIILCANRKTNFIFRYMLHHCYQGIELGEMYDEGFIIWLWEAFNSCVDFQAFVETIKKNGLYDPMYETILNEYYSRYQKNEKDIDKKWVCEIIEKLINVKPKYRLTNDKKQENHDNKVSEIP